VAQHCALLVKEIENSVMHVPVPHTQLVDPVSQEVRFGSPQFVTEFGQSLDSDEVFVSGLGLKLVHPSQQWCRAVVCSEDHNLCLRHSFPSPKSLSHFCDIQVNAFLR
jgi:hypothetical protein